MLVRLKQAATVVLEGIGAHWHPAGARVEIPDDHFVAALHEDLSAAADQRSATPSETADAAAGSEKEE